MYWFQSSYLFFRKILLIYLKYFFSFSVLLDGLSKSFRSVHVSEEDCPDLRQMPWTLAAPGLFRKTSLLCLCNFMNIYANRKCVSLSNTNLIIIYIVCSIYLYMYIFDICENMQTNKQRSRLIQRKLKYKLFWQSSLEIVIVLKGVPAPLFFKAPTPWPSLPLPPSKIFVSPHLFSAPPHFKVFWTVPPPSCNPLLP